VVLYQPGTGATNATTIKTNPVEVGESPALRLLEIKRRLLECWYGKQVDLVCLEAPAYSASGAYTGGLVAATTALALYERFDGTEAAVPILVASNTLKKFVSGKGTGHKSAMMMNVLKKWGHESANDNVADAYGLARLAAALRSGSEIKYEQECLATIERSSPWLLSAQPASSPNSPRRTRRT
jgi:Holliday junction resolvasome RuvABC endonuclease subunit